MSLELEPKPEDLADYPFANGKALILLHAFHALNYPRATQHRHFNATLWSLGILPPELDERPYEAPLVSPKTPLADKEALIRTQFVQMMGELPAGVEPVDFFRQRLAITYRNYGVGQVLRGPGRSKLDWETYIPADETVQAMYASYITQQSDSCAELAEYISQSPSSGGIYATGA